MRQTLFLASVRDDAEAMIALDAGADIIDFKEPTAGALGAVDFRLLDKGIRIVAGRASTSATVGDLPIQGQTLAAAVSAVYASGVDFVKLGVFPDANAVAALAVLGGQAARMRLIFVFFADALPEFDYVSVAASIGAHGVMLDTAGKASGSLLDHITIEEVADFVSRARAHGLFAGLAGSLKSHHVPELLRLEPDVLGFRGVLCRDGVRGAAIDPGACAAIRALIPQPAKTRATAEMREPIAPALC